jgi:hypothetical protein
MVYKLYNKIIKKIPIGCKISPPNVIFELEKEFKL